MGGREAQGERSKQTVRNARGLVQLSGQLALVAPLRKQHQNARFERPPLLPSPCVK